MGSDHAPLVTDHRPPARGLLSKGLKTWAALGTAAFIVVAIALSKDPPPEPVDEVPLVAGVPTTPERARRVETMLAETLRTPPAAPAPPSPVSVVPLPQPLAAGDELRVAPPPPMTDASDERSRREYDSLFTSPVVWTKRPGAADLMTKPRTVAAPVDEDSLEDRLTAAAIKQLGLAPQTVAPVKQDAGQVTAPPEPPRQNEPPSGTHRVFEGTVIDATLTNRIAGSMEGPVNGLVTNPVYAQDLALVIPAGARVLGSAKPVQTFGDERLAVAFHRVVLPDGRDVSLEKFIGMDQVGAVGLTDQVNRHYRSTFGAAAAVGLIAGFSQWVGSGFSRDRGGTVVIGGAVDATGQATSMTMNRFLNRLPTITIREGHRMKVYLTSDLDLPAWRQP